jgi:hypothetical protein
LKGGASGYAAGDSGRSVWSSSDVTLPTKGQKACRPSSRSLKRPSPEFLFKTLSPFLSLRTTNDRFSNLKTPLSHCSILPSLASQIAQEIPTYAAMHSDPIRFQVVARNKVIRSNSARCDGCAKFPLSFLKKALYLMEDQRKPGFARCLRDHSESADGGLTAVFPGQRKDRDFTGSDPKRKRVLPWQ